VWLIFWWMKNLISFLFFFLVLEDVEKEDQSSSECLCKKADKLVMQWLPTKTKKSEIRQKMARTRRALNYPSTSFWTKLKLTFMPTKKKEQVIWLKDKPQFTLALNRKYPTHVMAKLSTRQNPVFNTQKSNCLVSISQHKKERQTSLFEGRRKKDLTRKKGFFV
jgi:hypothetical protein